MDQWKNFEADTIKLYEEVGLFHPNTIGPGDDKFSNDMKSLINVNHFKEHKQCFSRFHSDELYDQFGFEANWLGYIRVDQLNRYQEEDKQNPDITRTILLDCRCINLETVSHVSRFIRRRGGPYQLRRMWTVTEFTTKQLWKYRQYTTQVEVPAWKRRSITNNPNWDGILQLIPLELFPTTNLSCKIEEIGTKRLLEAKHS